MDDDQLLHAYATDRSESAFRELVQRHGAMVYAVARRRPGVDAHLAHDITQRVFVSLARKAHSITGSANLVGWLFTAARLEAARVVRAEARRHIWEQKAGTMNHPEHDASSSPDDELDWVQLTPVLDEALATLAEADRQAVLLRYFSGRSFAEVGQSFQVSEDAARKRVDRAVEKLRQLLSQRGLTSSAAALSAALTTHGAPAVPAELLADLAHSAWQQAAIISPLVQLGLSMSSFKTALTTASVALFLAGAFVIYDTSALARAEADHSTSLATLAALNARHAAAQRELATLQQQENSAASRPSSTQATAPTPNAPFPTAPATPAPTAVPRPYLLDPAYHALAAAASQARRHLEFQRFFRRLQLSPAQITEFEDIMVKQDRALLDAQAARDAGRNEQDVFKQSGPAWSGAMRALLGEDGFADLQVYLRGNALRNFVDTIAAVSYESGEPLTLDQADRVIALALANDPTYQSGKGTDPGKVSWNAVWEPAGKFLSPTQLTTLETSVEVWALYKQIALAKKAVNPGPR